MQDLTKSALKATRITFEKAHSRLPFSGVTAEPAWGEARGGAAAGLGGARVGGAVSRLSRSPSRRPLPATRKVRPPASPAPRPYPEVPHHPSPEGTRDKKLFSLISQKHERKGAPSPPEVKH